MTPRRSFLASLILASAVAVSDVLPSFGFIREPEMVERLIWVPADRVLILGGGDGWYRVTFSRRCEGSLFIAINPSRSTIQGDV